MSSSYVRTLAKQYATALNVPFYDTINKEENPTDDAWLTIEFNSEYSEGTYNDCLTTEEGLIDLVFMQLPGQGDGLIATAEAEALAFYRNKDPSGKLDLYKMQPIEDFTDPDHYRVVVGIEYRYFK